MPPTADDITEIEGWFAESFPGHTVASDTIPSREVVLFRAHEEKPGAPRYELEVSYEAFEDHGGNVIVDDLRSSNADTVLRNDPATRLMYDRAQRLVPTDRHS